MEKTKGFIKWAAVVVLQLIATQVFTLVASWLVPSMGDFPDIQPVWFVVILGITTSLGVFLVGWVAVKTGRLNPPAKFPSRMIGTLLGAYLPLIVALFIYHSLGAGNPFFAVSILASILGFHLPAWLGRQ